MAPDADYQPVVTRLPEALEEEAEAIAEAEAIQRRLEADKAAREQLAANRAANEQAAKEAAAHAEDIERLRRESE
jgi:hypothetical protein